MALQKSLLRDIVWQAMVLQKRIFCVISDGVTKESFAWYRVTSHGVTKGYILRDIAWQVMALQKSLFCVISCDKPWCYKSVSFAWHHLTSHGGVTKRTFRLTQHDTYLLRDTVWQTMALQSIPSVWCVEWEESIQQYHCQQTSTPACTAGCLLLIPWQ